jgi:hypothetical protein
MLKTEIKISDILHLAADNYLAKDFEEEQESSWIKSHFSCDAVDSAGVELLGEKWRRRQGIHARIVQGLESMGCKTNSCHQFSELEQLSEGGILYECTPESQAARYFWLKWAALMAEDQGE